MKRLLLLSVLASAISVPAANAADGALVPLGAAKVDITPDFPVRMSGYGARKNESEGVAQKLWATALAIGGDDGAGPAVLVTVENCGLTAAIVEAVVAKLKESAIGNGNLKLSRERLAVSVTHTHTAPCLTNWAPYLFGAEFPAQHQQHVDQYTEELINKLADVTLAALANRRPGRLSWGTGQLGFAVNRRAIKDGRWAGFGVQADGPVDHSFQLLAAKDAEGKLIAVTANYACHCTTLGGDFNQIAGDWAGFAQEFIERDNPGAVALITIGCGADANPNPRGKLELARQHGQSLTDEVARLLKTDLKPLDAASLDCRLTHADLPFDTLPTKEQWQERAKAGGPTGYHAQRFLAQLESGVAIPTTLSYPVATWTFGNDLAIVFLGGEVVVDYAIRLRQEFAADRLWITAYANDVVGYIPSRRILREGGYEADFSMIYYARPTRFAPALEDVIVDTVRKILPPRFHAPAKQSEFSPPQSPAEALASIKVRPGWRVELVAAEPLIVDPVAFDWGPDGRLWVVEMRDYPLGLNGKGKPGGRVKVLSDTDDDGRYDKAEIFLDELPYPTGIKVWRKGILITAAPDIFYAEDTDGDGRADKRETLYAGFAEGNQQHRVNGLRWGLDNWLYVGNGDSGGTIKSLKTGAEIGIRGRDLRIRPDDGTLDAQSGQTQFGRECDDWGNWFGGNNSNPMWHYALEDHYLRRNPHFAPPDPKQQISIVPGASPVYPLSKTAARFNDFDKANRFTSACSPMVLRSSFPRSAWERTAGRSASSSTTQSVEDLRSHAERGSEKRAERGNEKREAGGEVSHCFICEPVHNLVHHEVMTESGFTFTSRRPDDEQQSEFLASTDNWFRPSMARTGPDGALWVADMYRAVIEHPQWIPADWQRRIDLRAGDDRGRIYRAFPADHPPRAVPRLDKLDLVGLIAALDSPNGWQRDMVQQMILWRHDRDSAVEPLERLALTAARPLARLHAMSTLDGLGKTRPELLSTMLKDAHAGVRRHSVRLTEPFLNNQPALGQTLVELADENEEHPQVQMQLAYTLGHWPDARAGRALAVLAKRHPQEKFPSAAITSGLNKSNLAEFVTAMFDTPGATPPAAAVEQWLSLAVAFDDNSLVNRLVQNITKLLPDAAPAEWQLAALAGLFDALDRRKQQTPQSLPIERLLDESARQQVTRFIALSHATAVSPTATLAQRVAALRLIGRNLTGASGTEELARLLTPQNSAELQAAVVVALAARGGDQVPGQLLSGWPSHSPNLRGQVLDILLSRPAWTAKLLDAVAKSEVLAAQLDARRRQQLLQQKDETLKARAAKLLAASSNANRQQVVDDFKDVAMLQGDAARGKALYAKRCSVCHRLDGVGHAVGPDFGAIKDRSPQAMLVAILDPNRAVEERYVEYIASTADGRLLSGVLTSETGNSITLTAQEGKQHIVLREQLDDLRATARSMMPEGIERDVSKQDFADLFRFLRDIGPPLPIKNFPNNRPEVVRAAADGSLTLPATHARIHGKTLVFEQPFKNLGYWQSEDDLAVWSLEVTKPGRYRVTFDYACHNNSSGNRYMLTLAGQSLSGQVAGTGTWDDYRTQEIGVVDLAAGPTDLTIRSADPVKNALLDLRAVRLAPAP